MAQTITTSVRDMVSAATGEIEEPGLEPFEHPRGNQARQEEIAVLPVEFPVRLRKGHGVIQAQPCTGVQSAQADFSRPGG